MDDPLARLETEMVAEPDTPKTAIPHLVGLAIGWLLAALVVAVAVSAGIWALTAIWGAILR